MQEVTARPYVIVQLEKGVLADTWICHDEQKASGLVGKIAGERCRDGDDDVLVELPAGTNNMVIFTLALAVGLIGGLYGIGGGAIIAPFCVSIQGLPVYTVAGAAQAGTFLTSIAGVTFYSMLAMTAVGATTNVAPDLALGALFGVGGLLGRERTAAHIYKSIWRKKL